MDGGNEGGVVGGGTTESTGFWVGTLDQLKVGSLDFALGFAVGVSKVVGESVSSGAGL